MAKIGVSLKIDVTKIEKARMFKGEKGTYLDATIFIDLDNEDQYGNHGMVTQSWKDAEKGQTPILGNGKIFWREGLNQGGGHQPQQGQQQPTFDGSEDDVPF